MPFDFSRYWQIVKEWQDNYPLGPRLSMGTFSASLGVNPDERIILVRDIPATGGYRCFKCDRQQVTLTISEARALRDYLTSLID